MPGAPTRESSKTLLCWRQRSLSHWGLFANSRLCVCLACTCRAEGGRRRGYMGHLTRIANSIVHNCDKGPNGTQIQRAVSGEPSRLQTDSILILHHRCSNQSCVPRTPRCRQGEMGGFYFRAAGRHKQEEHRGPGEDPAAAPAPHLSPLSVCWVAC